MSKNPSSERELATEFVRDIEARPIKPKRSKAKKVPLSDADYASHVRSAKIWNRRQNIRLRKVIAYWSIGVVVAQLVASNVFFGYYLWQSGAGMATPVMVAWLSSSVVEVISILGIVAISLFPRKNGNGDK